MSCVLPQFKWPLLHRHRHHHHHHRHVHGFNSGLNPKLRNVDCVFPAKELHFRAQCAFSTTAESPSAAVLDLEKLRLSTSLEANSMLSTSLEANSNLAVANETWTYSGAIGPPFEETFQSTLDTETLITSDEAVIRAAAAEAIALARAAVRVAKEAVALAEADCNKTTSQSHSSTTTNSFSAMRSQLTEADRAHILGDDVGHTSTEDESDESLEPTPEELSLLEEQQQLYEDTAVRSTRQMERKVRRDKAAEKVSSTTSIASARYNSMRRKKRAAVKQVDHSDRLRFLRSAASGSKLLTSAQERECSEGIQDLLKLERLQEELKERYGGEPTYEQWATAAGIDQQTLRKRLNHGTFCKDKMVKSNIRLVISIAKNYQNAGLNLEDLVQEGCIGLVRSAEKFDATKGFKFSTYAHWWIKQALRKALSERSRTIRIPLHIVNDGYKVKTARRQLENQHGRDPTNEEIAEAAGISMKRLEAVLATPKQPTSLDRKIGDMDLKPSEILSDPNAESLDEILMKSLLKQDLKKVLESLNPREREVIRWRFGLDDGRVKTLQEIGELVGVSRERIRQIEASAYQKLKRKKWTKQLQQYANPQGLIS
ncbi:RNA polymerase sigma factor sigB [Linum grandiflorum]